MIEISVIRDLVAIFGVIAGFSYYVLTVRNAQRNQQNQLETRQAQLFMQIYDRFIDKEFQKDWRTFVFTDDWKDYAEYLLNSYGIENLETSTQNAVILHYFEGVGVLVEEGLIDVNLVAKLLSASVIQCWEKVGPYVLEQRERQQLPRIFDKTEYLYNEMKRVRGADWSYEKTRTIVDAF